MSVVPVIFSGVFYPKNKKDQPMAGTFVGNAAVAGLEVGGGPIEGGGNGDDDLIIWGPSDPRPSLPIYWPGFPNNPPPNITPPEGFPDKPGPVKQFPEEGGWGYSDHTGWVFKPGPTEPGPKK